MKKVEELAQYVTQVRFEDLTPETIQALKIRILDSLGCGIGALQSPVVKKLKQQLDDFGGTPLVTLIGNGKTSPDRAALYNGALIRFLDFNDSFLAKKETCHPSDNLSSVLAATEYTKGSGKTLLLSLAIAYQVQCQLSEVAPVRDKGFDHTTQGTYAVAAGVSKALNLNMSQTANALAMAGVANNALRVTRTGALSHWKGLAYPQTAFSSTHAAFLAYRNITGPLEIFEGNKGFMHSISGPFDITWAAQGLSIVLKTIIKKFNAEIHSQTTLEGILELKAKHGIDPLHIKHIEVEIFDVAFNIIGGGEEGTKKIVRTKEEADHSLPYMIAAALLDNEVTPRQYEAERIVKNDIQTLLQKVTIRPKAEYSQRFPLEMVSHIVITMDNGDHFDIEKHDYEGFTTKPMTWEQTLKKFNSLTESFASQTLRNQIADTVHKLDNVDVTALTTLLGQISTKDKL